MAEGTKKAAAGAPAAGRLRVAPIDEAWLDPVRDIEALCYPTPWSRESFTYALGGGYRCIGAADGRELAGFLIYSRVEDEVHILNVAVHPRYRQRGVGARLLEWLHGRERTAGAQVVFLEVSRDNLAAQKLYAKFGYQQIGTRKAYYHDNKEDALVLSLEL